MLRFSLFLLLIFTCYAKEPSAFERQSGATKKDLLDLQSSMQNISNLMDSLARQYKILEQSQEGLQSLYESQTQKLQNTLNKTLNNEEAISNLKIAVIGLKNTLESFLNRIDELNQQNENNQAAIETLDSKLQEMRTLMLQTQENILDKLQELIAQNTVLSKDSKQQTPSKPNKPKTYDSSKKPELFAEAKELITAKQYKAAKDIMLWLKDVKYQQPEVLFYLGEIAYLQRDYKLAIRYYKNSVNASEKGEYIPTLLLHSAISFKGIKDITNYNSFLQALVSNYPESKEAATARKLQQKDSKESNQYKKE